jgi:hypothetical protein
MSGLKEDTHTGSIGNDSGDLKTPYNVEDGLEPDAHRGTAVGTAAAIDHQAERALCRKFDVRLMPILALMYLFNALDKGNLGNAKTNGMDVNLGFKGNQYNIVLSVFYVPYVLFAPPIVRLAPVLQKQD